MPSFVRETPICRLKKQTNDNNKTLTPSNIHNCLSQSLGRSLVDKNAKLSLNVWLIVTNQSEVNLKIFKRFI